MMPGQDAARRVDRSPSRLRRISSRTRSHAVARRLQLTERSSVALVRAASADWRADHHGRHAETTSAGDRDRAASERGAEPVVGVEQVLRHDPHVGDHRHEVRVAGPARHEVPVQMVGDAGARRTRRGSCRRSSLGAQRSLEDARARGGASPRDRRARPSGRSGSAAVCRRGATIRWPFSYGIAVQHHDARRASRRGARRSRGSPVGAAQKMHPRRRCARRCTPCARAPRARPCAARRAIRPRRHPSGVQGLPSTRRRSSLPTLKNGTRLACTGTSSPVFGLRPSRAWRCFTTKLPKPRISMRSPARERLGHAVEDRIHHDLGVATRERGWTASAPRRSDRASSSSPGADSWQLLLGTAQKQPAASRARTARRRNGRRRSVPSHHACQRLPRTLASRAARRSDPAALRSAISIARREPAELVDEPDALRLLRRSRCGRRRAARTSVVVHVAARRDRRRRTACSTSSTISWKSLRSRRSSAASGVAHVLVEARSSRSLP